MGPFVLEPSSLYLWRGELVEDSDRLEELSMVFERLDMKLADERRLGFRSFDDEKLEGARTFGGGTVCWRAAALSSSWTAERSGDGKKLSRGACTHEERLCSLCAGWTVDVMLRGEAGEVANAQQAVMRRVAVRGYRREQ